MRFFALATLGLAAVSSAASLGKRDDNKHSCLCAKDVDTLIDAYLRLLSNYNADDLKYLADDGFYDWSDSINTLAGIPTGTKTFPSKAAFQQHEETQPDHIPITLESKGPYNCDQLSFIWDASFPATVRGITIIGATKTSGDWQIQNINVEFNALNYLTNIGGTWSPPPAPPS